MTKPLSMDQAFLKRLTEIVLDNLPDEDFNVDQLAKAAGMSHATLHRRLRAIKNQDVTHFIREVRLQRAMELLSRNEGNASEIAFKVGYGSPAYFTKCFHEYYGFPPGDVRKKTKPEEEDSIFQDPDDNEGSGQILKGLNNTLVRLKKTRRNVILLLSAFAFIVVALALFILNRATSELEDKSIIVLPFKNLTNDTDNQHIADGIMEDILNQLYKISSVSDLSVRSRTTSEHFRGTSLTTKEIAREVKARNVLEGSLRRYGDDARISIQLINAHKDQHLWSENYDRALNDIFGIQGEIALQVANRLNVVLSDKEAGNIRDLPTQNPEAYDYFVKGRFLFNKANDEQRIDIDREGLLGSIRNFEKAVALDSAFSEAWAGLSDAWFTVSAWGWYQPYFEGIMNARKFSDKALELDPDCAEAHLVKGAYLIWPERKWEEGKKELRSAIQLNPNIGYAHQAYAQLLMITGPIEEARLHMNRVIELEPFFWVMHNLNAWIYYFEEKHEKAIEACKIARELKSDYILTNWLFFLNYSKLGEGEKAMKELQAIARSNPRSAVYADEIMDAYRKSGIDGLFNWLTDININRPVPIIGMSGQPFFTAWWYAILGKREESIYWLERNMESANRNYTFFNLMATNPDFDILRDDPRFLSIIDKIGLSPYNKRPTK